MSLFVLIFCTMETPEQDLPTLPPNRVGYARVSSAAQNLDSQYDALQKAGCGRIFSDKMTGSRLDRPGWEELMGYLRSGDTIVVTELSRLVRSLLNLLEITQQLEQRQINLVSLRDNIDTSTATGRCFLSMMGAIYQMERELKSERAEAGRVSARARGKTGGRPRTSIEKLENARVLYENSAKTAEEVCQVVGIGRRSFFAYLAQQRAEAGTHALVENLS
jgi:DNA invertase Pin-like site-specific DNA recombinase